MGVAIVSRCDCVNVFVCLMYASLIGSRFVHVHHSIDTAYYI